MNPEKETTRISKLLSYVLRHSPEALGIELEENGWAGVEELLTKLQAQREPVSRDVLQHIVDTNNKKRFSFNEDGTKIRASQGHSVEVDLGYSQQQPPEFLYHGTVGPFIEDIKKEGISKRQRHQVHLSADEATAIIVAQRRGKPVILKIKAGEMAAAGFTFYLSDNGVWLTDAVPPAYILFP